MKKAKTYALAHKVLSTVIILACIGGGYGITRLVQSKNTEIRYISTTVEKGTLITTVTGSGQISAVRQVDIKSKASGDIVAIYVKTGQSVKAGDLLVRLDTTDAQKTVRDAQMSLENAQIALQKLQGPAYLAIPRNKQDAQDALDKAYTDALNTVSNVFLDFPTIMTGLNDILIGNTLTMSQWNIDWYANRILPYDTDALQYRNDAHAKYTTARPAYEAAFDTYKSVSRMSSHETIDSLINTTYAAAQSITDALKSANNLIQLYKDKLTEHGLKANSVADTHLSSLNGYISKATSAVSNIRSATSSIKSAQQSYQDVDLDIRSQELSIQQKQNALAEAKAALANYVVRTPIEGVVAKVNVTTIDSVNSGTAVATVMTNQKVAGLSLNEIDAAKVKLGQKVTLTFDAISDFTTAGSVIDLDIVGTVSQGVTSYTVKIGFDTQDERIKAGMTVSANIITNSKTDVLTVPSSAIKIQNDTSYVQVLENSIPVKKKVTTRLTNDTMTEIVSGLEEGDQVVTQTISTSASSKTSSPSSTNLSNNRSGMPPMMGI